MLDNAEISQILDMLEKNSSNFKEYADFLRLNPPSDPSILESGIIKSVSISEFSGLLCAVDAGIHSEFFHGVDFVVSRTSSVLFLYDKNNLQSVSYMPSKFPRMKISAKTGLDDHETSVFKSLKRLNEEISLAIKSIESKKPRVLLIDGSLLPLASDRPADGSSLLNDYIEVAKLYSSLFKAAGENNCLLIGITKDSRGKRFIDLLGNEKCRQTSDSFFLDFLLKPGERTCAIAYHKESGKSPMLKDIGAAVDSVSIFYLKSSEHDRPMRVEFLNGSRSIDEVASLVYSLSMINSSYAYPAALIEVDLCAAIGRSDAEMIQKALVRRFDILHPLKRNSRPFR